MLIRMHRALILPFVVAFAALAAAPGVTVDGARKFISDVEATLDKLNVMDSRASWVKDTYITDDTEILAAKADEEDIRQTVDFVHQAEPFAALPLPPDLARKFRLLKLSLTVAAPADPAKAAELTQITSSMEGTYGKGKFCPPDGKKCLDLEELSRILRTSRNPEELKQTWVGWRAISPPMRKPYERYVELANEGASSGSPIRARCGGRNMTCLQTISPPRPTVSGTRSARCIFHFTLTCAAGCMRSMATCNRPRGRFALICWETCGPSSGTTSIRWWLPRMPTPATI